MLVEFTVQSGATVAVPYHLITEIRGCSDGGTVIQTVGGIRYQPREEYIRIIGRYNEAYIRGKHNA